MSSLKVEALHRELFYNGTRIPDPAPNLTVEQVREILTPTYPEIATANLHVGNPCASWLSERAGLAAQS